MRRAQPMALPTLPGSKSFIVLNNFGTVFAAEGDMWVSSVWADSGGFSGGWI